MSVYLCGYELTADIDANASCPNYDGSNGDDLTPDDNDSSNPNDCGDGQSAWVPVGTSSAKFTGIFNGNGHRISNLYYKANADYGGLFGYCSRATITNVGINAVYIDTGTNDYAGGLVGRVDNSAISYSYATGSVSGDDYIGGLVGRATGNSAISYSYATGSVSGDTWLGGLVGQADNSAISYSYATGNISCVQVCGGLVGSVSSSGSISKSYAVGSVSGDSFVGGLVGGTDGPITIANSYAAGSVSGNRVGGLVGSVGENGNIVGKNYYVAAAGTNGGCPNSNVCIRAVSADDTDDERRAWLQATLDESTANDANPAGLGWDGSVWGDFTAAGKYPCLKNMPAGAPVCE